MKGEQKQVKEFTSESAATQFQTDLHQDENCESYGLVRERSQPGIGKLEIRPIKDIKAGTTVFKSDGTAGQVVRTWATHGERIGTRIIWENDEKETNQAFKENKTFGVDAVDFAENLAKWETQQKNEAIAEKMEARASRISLAASYLTDRRKNVDLEAFDIKRPGERQTRIDEFNEKLKVLEALRSYFMENEYLSGLVSVSSHCSAYRQLDEVIREVKRSVEAVQPIDEAKFKDWGKYVAEMSDEVDKWTENHYFKKS